MDLVSTHPLPPRGTATDWKTKHNGAGERRMAQAKRSNDCQRHSGEASQQLLSLKTQQSSLRSVSINLRWTSAGPSCPRRSACSLQAPLSSKLHRRWQRREPRMHRGVTDLHNIKHFWRGWRALSTSVFSLLKFFHVSRERGSPLKEASIVKQVNQSQI